MNKNEQVKGMANPNRGSVGVQEAQPAPVPLTDEKAISLILEVVSTSNRPIGMDEYGLLVFRAIEAAHSITKGGET
jgi:hypothetical protein